MSEGNFQIGIGRAPADCLAARGQVYISHHE